MVENLQSFYRWRRVALFAGMLICLCAGICYTWSVFQKPFMDLFGWSTKATSLTYTLHTVSSTILPVFVGPLQAKIRIRYYLLAGMAFYAMGLILTSFTFALPFLYLTFGFLTGIGAGMMYTCLMAYGVRIFRIKKVWPQA